MTPEEIRTWAVAQAAAITAGAPSDKTGTDRFPARRCAAERVADVLAAAGHIEAYVTGTAAPGAPGAE